MENFIPQDQVPNLYKANFRFREGSARKYKRAQKRKNEKPVKLLTIINNL